MANRVVEFRIFRLHHGQRGIYTALFEDHLLPLLKHHGIEVLSWGASLHDRLSFYIVTVYDSVEDRRDRLNDLFGSQEWLVRREGDVMAMIETANIGVAEASEALIAAIRSSFVGAREENLDPPGWR